MGIMITMVMVLPLSIAYFVTTDRLGRGSALWGRIKRQIGLKLVGVVVRRWRRRWHEARRNIGRDSASARIRRVSVSFGRNGFRVAKGASNLEK